MFTGIVEAFGEVLSIHREGKNIHYTLTAPIAGELQIDQSVAHDGVCLTVTGLHANTYTVCAIEETLGRSTLSSWVAGRLVNLERAMKMGDRLDGHLVQGHVDAVAECTSIQEHDGSWHFSFTYKQSAEHLTVEKGSICINGVSLTVVDSGIDQFSVAIIPYTFEHTTFKELQVGDKVNLEFDVIGKYVAKIMADR